MSEKVSTGLTERHLLLFGTIIQWFARYESLMQEIMATVSGADATSIKLLTDGIGFAEKRRALLNLLRHRAVPFDQIEQIQSYLQVVRTFAQLRDDIAHSVWITGQPQNLIWPAWLTHGPLTAVKPLHDLGKHMEDFVEDKDDKVTYTLDDFADISESLATNYTGLREYAVGHGLAPSNGG